MPADGHRTESSKTRGQRVHESRRLNYLEQARDRAAVVWSDGDADLNAEGNAEWGEPLYVEDFERLHLVANFTFGDVGNNITTLFVGMQASPSGGDSDWYDVYADEADNGVLVRKLYELPATADFKITWPDTRRVNRFMRFKVWTDGTIRVDSRARLRARRVMDAM